MSAVVASALPGRLKPYATACAFFAADDGSRVFPSVATIARKAGRSRRATQLAIQQLAAIGVLEVVAPARQHQATHYRFHAAKMPLASDGVQLVLPLPQGFPQPRSRKTA